MPGFRITMIKIIFVVCVLVFLSSGLLLFLELREYRKDQESYEKLSHFVISKQEFPEASALDSSSSIPPTETPLPRMPGQPREPVDFALLLEQAPDAVAWVMQEDTVINYPVVQGDDNDYYLNHLYDGTENEAGCLFTDFQNSPDFSDKNSIVYGHNMQDGSMFASLKRYEKQGYYDDHLTMLLITPGHTFCIEFFTAFTASPSEHGTVDSPWLIEWETETAYEEWLRKMQKRSVIESDVFPDSSDKVLTLSTCAPGGTDRFIVMGRLAEYE